MTFLIDFIVAACVLPLVAGQLFLAGGQIFTSGLSIIDSPQPNTLFSRPWLYLLSFSSLTKDLIYHMFSRSRLKHTNRFGYIWRRRAVKPSTEHARQTIYSIYVFKHLSRFVRD